MNSASLANEVQNILQRAKINRQEIAKKLGVTAGMLSQWSSDTLISEPYLAGLVNEAVDGPSAVKERELLRLLFILWQERFRRGNEPDDKKKRWTDETQELAINSFKPVLALSEGLKAPIIKSSGRTLCDFPDSFYPLAIISGDKREDSESRITAGDFGAVSASPAEFRWLCELGLQN